MPSHPQDRELLEGRYAPTTYTVGFFEASLEIVADGLYSWKHALDNNVRREALDTPFPEVLHHLEPLTNVGHNRELLVPTASRWTAYFDNGAMYPDPFGPVSVLAEDLDCRTLMVTCTADVTPSKSVDGQRNWGAVVLELYGPEQTDWLNLIREIRLANDASGWEFRTSGEPQPYERLEQYAARRKRDRFTPDMLDEYCQALGIRFFDPSFYGPGGVLVENPETYGGAIQFFTREEAQRHYVAKRKTAT